MQETAHSYWWTCKIYILYLKFDASHLEISPRDRNWNYGLQHSFNYMPFFGACPVIPWFFACLRLYANASLYWSIPWTSTIKKHDNEQSKCCGSWHDLYLDWGQIDELMIMWGRTYRLEWSKFWLVVEDVKPRVLVQAEIWLITSPKSLHKKEIYFADSYIKRWHW